MLFNMPSSKVPILKFSFSLNFSISSVVIYLALNSPFNKAVLAEFESAMTLNTTPSRFGFPSK